MFIEKARQLETVHAIGGIVLDTNLSLKSSNHSIFSMTGDGNNNVDIPLVLMFKDEAFQLLHLLSKQPKLIIYIGDENYLSESFYQQMDYIESLIEPFNGRTDRWIYGQLVNKQCSIVPNKLKQLELTIEHMSHTSKGNVLRQSVGTVENYPQKTGRVRKNPKDERRLKMYYCRIINHVVLTFNRMI